MLCLAGTASCAFTRASRHQRTLAGICFFRVARFLTPHPPCPQLISCVCVCVHVCVCVFAFACVRVFAYALAVLRATVRRELACRIRLALKSRSLDLLQKQPVVCGDGRVA